VKALSSIPSTSKKEKKKKERKKEKEKPREDIEKFLELNENL
jgi:hypothetical protein